MEKLHLSACGCVYLCVRVWVTLYSNLRVIPLVLSSINWVILVNRIYTSFDPEECIAQ